MATAWNCVTWPPDMASAERWMATNRYLDMRAEVVADPEALPQVDIRPGSRCLCSTYT
jgi:hypothetical protein